MFLITEACFVVLCQKAPNDSSNFDSEFTMEKPVLTPVDSELLKTMNQAIFKGFSFTCED